MILTKRDKFLLQKLLSYGLLTTRQVLALVFNGVAATTVLRRLRILEKAELICRIPLLGTGALAWCATPKGGAIVSILLPKKTFRPDHLEHELKLVSLRIALEGSEIAQSWIPEHEIRHKVFQRNGLDTGRRMLVPDGIMGVESLDGPESVAIELELNFKNSGRWVKVFRDYRSRKTIRSLWYVVDDASIGRAALKAWKETSFIKSNLKFYWSELNAALKYPTAAILHGEFEEVSLSSRWLESLGAQGAAQSLSSSDEGKTQQEAGANP